MTVSGTPTHSYWGFTGLPLTKSKTIGVHGRLLARSAGDIVEAASTEVVTGLLFKFVRVGGYGWEAVAEDAIFVNFLCSCIL